MAGGDEAHDCLRPSDHDDHLPQDAIQQLERLLDEVVRADKDMEMLSQELRGLNLSLDGESRTDKESSLLGSGEEQLLALVLSPDSPILPSLNQDLSHTCHTLKTHEAQADGSFNVDVSADSCLDCLLQSSVESTSLLEVPDPDANRRKTLHRSHSDTDALPSPAHSDSSRRRELRKVRAGKRNLAQDSPRSVGDPLPVSEQDLLLECSSILSYEIDKLNRSGFV
eukprot:752578-Hanusia_phi.AAC.3